MSTIFCLISLTITVFTVSSEQDLREYSCVRGKQGMDCRLSFDGNLEWDAINDSGCFRELNGSRGEVLEYCPLQCHDFSRATFVGQPESSNCGNSSSFGLAKRTNDWFLWRASPCDKAETTFRISCDGKMRSTHEKKQAKLPMQNEEKEKRTREEDQPKKSMVFEEDADNEDDLPMKVDALLRAMFPAYRKQQKIME